MKNAKTKLDPVKELAAKIVDKISTPIYDALIELHNIDSERQKEKDQPTLSRQEKVLLSIEDLLDKIEDYQSFKLSDLNSLDFDYIRDTIISEYADSETEIYNYWLWRHAPALSSFIEDSLEEYGNAEETVKRGGLVSIFTQGEYYFYDQFANEVVNALEEIKDDQK